MSEDARDRRSAKLLLSMALNLGITLAQIVGGLLSGSLALLSDALHNLSDVMALGISWVAIRLSRQEYSPERTFGTRRAELLAALINGSMLMAVSLFLILEALGRVGHPPAIDSFVVVALAAAGVAVNGLSALMFRRDAKVSLNIRSVYLNLLTDMFSSVAVLGGGLLMLHYGVYWVDLALTGILGLALMYSAGTLLRESIEIFMLYTPKHIDPLELERVITSLGPVKGVHHMHVWRLVDDEVHLEAHLELFQDMSVSALNKLLDELHGLLLERFGITHVTMQPEFGREGEKHLILPLDEQDHSQGR